MRAGRCSPPLPPGEGLYVSPVWPRVPGSRPLRDVRGHFTLPGIAAEQGFRRAGNSRKAGTCSRTFPRLDAWWSNSRQSRTVGRPLGALAGIAVAPRFAGKPGSPPSSPLEGPSTGERCDERRRSEPAPSLRAPRADDARSDHGRDRLRGAAPRAARAAAGDDAQARHSRRALLQPGEHPLRDRGRRDGGVDGDDVRALLHRRGRGRPGAVRVRGLDARRREAREGRAAPPRLPVHGTPGVRARAQVGGRGEGRDARAGLRRRAARGGQARRQTGFVHSPIWASRSPIRRPPPSTRGR